MTCVSCLARRYKMVPVMLIPDLTEVGFFGNGARQKVGGGAGFSPPYDPQLPGPRIIAPNVIPSQQPKRSPDSSNGFGQAQARPPNLNIKDGDDGGKLLAKSFIKREGVGECHAQ